MHFRTGAASLRCMVGGVGGKIKGFIDELTPQSHSAVYSSTRESPLIPCPLTAPPIKLMSLPRSLPHPIVEHPVCPSATCLNVSQPTSLRCSEASRRFHLTWTNGHSPHRGAPRPMPSAPVPPVTSSAALSPLLPPLQPHWPQTLQAAPASGHLHGLFA